MQAIDENLGALRPATEYGSASVGTGVSTLVSAHTTSTSSRWVRVVNGSNSNKLFLKITDKDDAAPTISSTVGNADIGMVILPEQSVELLLTAFTVVYGAADTAGTDVYWTVFQR